MFQEVFRRQLARARKIQQVIRWVQTGKKSPEVDGSRNPRTGINVADVGGQYGVLALTLSTASSKQQARPMSTI